MKNTRIKRIRALCECAIMLALSIVLSYIKLLPELPFGGSVTMFSMLPVCLVAIKYGWKWGLGTSFCFSWFQILQGGVFSWGLTPGMLIGSLLLDYILAFTVLGFAGIFSKKGTLGSILGIGAGFLFVLNLPEIVLQVIMLIITVYTGVSMLRKKD